MNVYWIIIKDMETGLVCTQSFYCGAHLTTKRYSKIVSDLLSWAWLRSPSFWVLARIYRNGVWIFDIDAIRSEKGIVIKRSDLTIRRVIKEGV